MSGHLKDGISFRYVVLDTMEKFGISPVEWDKIDKDTRLEMIAKRNLDYEYEEYIKEQSKQEIENNKSKKDIKRNRKGNRGI